MRGWLFDIRSWLRTQATRIAKSFRRFNLSIQEYATQPSPSATTFFSKVVVEMELVAGEGVQHEETGFMPVLITGNSLSEPSFPQSPSIEQETPLSEPLPEPEGFLPEDEPFSEPMSEEPELSSEVATDAPADPSTAAIPILSERPAIQSAADDSIFTVVSSEDHSIMVQVRGESLSLAAALESLLFVADSSVEVGQFVKLFSLPVDVIEAELTKLGERLKGDQRGIRLQVQNGRYRLVSAPAAANLIESFLNLDLSTRLSAPALESLSVIAYRQPVTRAQIEAVRGVDCGHVLRSLVQRGLIEESGRLETVGRPILYSVTEQFMQHFGLTTLNELPPLETTEAARLMEATELAEE